MECTRIVAVRHGETDWNADGRVQGHTDIALNARGREQARRVGAALAGAGLHRVIASDLGRARETAQAIADAAGAPLTVDAGLRERAFGAIEGQSFEQVRRAWPEHAERWRTRDPAWCPPGEGGESLLVFQGRVARAVQALAADHMGRHVALVAHGGVLDVLYRLATGLDLRHARSWPLANCAINRLLWSPAGGLTLLGWADEAHLEDAARDEAAA